MPRHIYSTGTVIDQTSKLDFGFTKLDFGFIKLDLRSTKLDLRSTKLDFGSTKLEFFFFGGGYNRPKTKKGPKKEFKTGGIKLPMFYCTCRFCVAPNGT
jgi:hypothetical protein